MSGWHNFASLPTHKYKCGYCGYNVANDRGYPHNDASQRIYFCANCDGPSFFRFPGTQVPGIVPGDDVAHLPAELEKLYREARNCCGVGAFTASVLASRKMLMNIAVAQGASAGESFMKYVEYLAASGYIPPNGKGWVDHIRKKGNEATHEIALMSKPDAEELVAFVEMLLKFIYEFPARTPASAP